MCCVTAPPHSTAGEYSAFIHGISFLTAFSLESLEILSLVTFPILSPRTVTTVGPCWFPFLLCSFHGGTSGKLHCPCPAFDLPVLWTVLSRLRLCISQQSVHPASPPLSPTFHPLPLLQQSPRRIQQSATLPGHLLCPRHRPRHQKDLMRQLGPVSQSPGSSEEGRPADGSSGHIPRASPLNESGSCGHCGGAPSLAWGGA